jgi:hypothetical protein
MHAVMDISPRRETRGTPDLEAYLLACGGQDILEFSDIDGARAATEILRLREPGVLVETRYTRVHLRLYEGAL